MLEKYIPRPGPRLTKLQIWQQTQQSILTSPPGASAKFEKHHSKANTARWYDSEFVLSTLFCKLFQSTGNQG
jgi:hypothetical protein